MSNAVAPWGQAGAIVLLLYLFIVILVGLGLAAAMMLAFAWIREKAELFRKVRPLVDELNQAVKAAKRGEPLPREIASNKLISTVVQVPKMAATLPDKASNIEQKVEQGSGRVADVVIELHARTKMAKGVLKAFFLPGLTRPRPVIPVQQAVTPEREQEIIPERRDEERPLEQEIVITQSSR